MTSEQQQQAPQLMPFHIKFAYEVMTIQFVRPCCPSIHGKGRQLEFITNVSQSANARFATTTTAAAVGVVVVATAPI